MRARLTGEGPDGGRALALRRGGAAIHKVGEHVDHATFASRHRTPCRARRRARAGGLSGRRERCWDQRPRAAACALDLRAGFKHCNLKLLGDANEQAAGDHGAVGLRPGRPAERLRARRAAATGGSQTVAIVDAFDDTTAEADLGTYRSQYGLPGVHDGQRLLQEGQPVRRAGVVPAGRPGLGPGDQPRPRHGLGGLPELPHPARRGDLERQRQPLRRGRHRGAPRARPRSPTATAARSPAATQQHATTTTRASRSRLSGDGAEQDQKWTENRDRNGAVLQAPDGSGEVSDLFVLILMERHETILRSGSCTIVIFIFYAPAQKRDDPPRPKG